MKMMQRVIGFSGAVVLAAGLMASSTPAAQAQNAGNEPGSNTAAKGGTQGEINFLAHMRRNTKIETDISKMALKNSQSAAVKKLAKQVIQDNRKDEMAMTGAASPNPNLAQSYYVPKPPQQTVDSEKKLKSLKGSEFDRMYISMLAAFVQDDQKAIEQASQSMNDSELGPLIGQMKQRVEKRSKLLQQTAESEHLKIE
jgi:predicted outer membrane protein